MLRRLSVDGSCQGIETCQSVWGDDDWEDVVVVGLEVAPDTVPLAPGEVAARIRRRIIIDAGLG
ncbi:hypothetical protein [Pseudonocardia spinosispora]|uniref:hypothetical protein n=1 Tax=Pseudonocardia spinosispora TaxID=103441 RepID=UPI00048CDA8F|nr:hypothetical protein [Pseudonocardia spinosispora]